MIITEEQFFDYMNCPTKYELKHINKMDIGESKSLSKLISPVAGYFFASIFNGRIPTVDSLKRQWDKICEDNIDYIDPKKNLNGISLLINLHRYAENRKLVVLDYGTSYNVDTDNGNKLRGSTSNPIVSVNGKGMELLVPYYNNRIPKAIELDTKLKFTIESLGFEQSFNQRLDGINVFVISRDEEYNTTRSHMDYTRLKYAIDGVCKGIENEVFYPRESAFCDSCEARAFCRYWSGHK